MVFGQTKTESGVADNSEDGTPPAPSAVGVEQAYLTMLYALLDESRERGEQALSEVRAQGGAGGTHQARLERDVAAAEYESRLAQLNPIYPVPPTMRQDFIEKTGLSFAERFAGGLSTGIENWFK